MPFSSASSSSSSSSSTPQPPSQLSYFASMVAQKRHPPQDTRPSFAGQTILVTGANTGVGLEAAVKFARQHAARLILAVRSRASGEAAKKHIQAQISSSSSSSANHSDSKGSSAPRTAIEVWELDMLSYPSILAFAARAAKEVPEGLRAAVLNAGVMPFTFSLAPSGWEREMQVNTLSTVLLALALMPVLKRWKGGRGEDSSRAVLELVGSTNHYMTKLLPDLAAKPEESVFEVYSREENFALVEQYNVTKLFLMKELVELAKATKEGESDVDVVTVCPGPCTSDLSRDGTAWYMVVGKFIIKALIMKTPEQGARTYISGVTLGEKGNGRFWTDDQIKEPAPLLVGKENEVLQRRVWHDIINALRRDVPEVDQYIQQKQ